MLEHMSRVIKNRPLLAIEHMLYILLTVSGVWGLIPNNPSLSLDRLANQFGVHMVLLQYAVFLIVGIYGHLSLVTVRIEHRINTTRLAFLAFAYSGVANLGVFVFGGNFNPVSIMLSVTCALISGIIYLHLKIYYRLGVRGREAVPR